MSRPRPSGRIHRSARCAALLLLLALPAGAAPLSVSDGTATVTADDQHGGLTAFILGGVDHLFQADYYFRRAGMTAEQALTGTTETVVSSVTATSPTEITVLGSATGFNFTLVYALDGLGRLRPSLTIQNTQATPLTISIFAYHDWDVNGSAGGDTITWNGFDMIQSQGATLIRVTPQQTPSAMQAGTFSGIRNELRDGNVDNLTGAGLPYTGSDGTFAFQFNLVIPTGGGGNILISVPEPSSGVLAALGLIGLAWWGRDRRVRA
jgi:hypothetical protein